MLQDAGRAGERAARRLVASRLGESGRFDLDLGFVRTVRQQAGGRTRHRSDLTAAGGGRSWVPATGWSCSPIGDRQLRGRGRGRAESAAEGGPPGALIVVVGGGEDRGLGRERGVRRVEALQDSRQCAMAPRGRAPLTRRSLPRSRLDPGPLRGSAASGAGGRDRAGQDFRRARRFRERNGTGRSSTASSHERLPPPPSRRSRGRGRGPDRRPSAS